MKHVWSASKEPLGSAAAREGVSLAGHGGAYTLDSVFRWRAWGGWMRPSFFLGFASFALAALTGGKWRVVFRNSGQGVLHHYFARGLDIVHGYLAPGAPSGTAGAEEQGEPGSTGY